MPIAVERIEPQIVRVAIDRPERRNALGEAEFRALAEIWARLAADSTVRAVLVEGRGDAFCSGADLSAALDSLPDVDELVDAALLKTRFFPVPLVAAIVGPCVAGGLELALSCDVRIFAADARVGLPEVRWGILPSGGAAMKLGELAGHSAAMRMLLTGELFDGSWAAAAGLGSLARDAESARAEALRVARAIATASPVAVRAAKRAALEASCRDRAAREPAERALAAEVRASGHPRMGVEAFLAHRTPVFPDRGRGPEEPK